MVLDKLLAEVKTFRKSDGSHRSKDFQNAFNLMPAFSSKPPGFRADAWQGLEGVIKVLTRPANRFIYSFKDTSYSVRAVLRIISVYRSKYKVSTWEQFFSRWDSSSKNIAVHAKMFRQSIGKEFSQMTTEDLAKFVKELSRMETGEKWLTEESITQGVNRWLTSYPSDESLWKGIAPLVPSQVEQVASKAISDATRIVGKVDDAVTELTRIIPETEKMVGDIQTDVSSIVTKLGTIRKSIARLDKLKNGVVSKPFLGGE